ncbi:hypothetical protein M9H77_04372 [Catharanthus roseus]|uniref:Uncharacterized protein n=1 Tax=Catharanthus roseus TaxID=4058 RepID=A0ACC0CEC8_CATRO|nr:hypothetical protein M9H77_04372 [Catharanthus roseus]
MRNIGCDPTKKRVFLLSLWVPPSKEDRMRDRNSDDDGPNESYNPSDDEEDEAGSQNTIPMDAFQTELRTTFEQLRITQEIQGMKLTKMVESTRRYANELPYQSSSIDYQEIILARLCQRFMSDQGSSGGGGTDFGPYREFFFLSFYFLFFWFCFLSF